MRQGERISQPIFGLFLVAALGFAPPARAQPDEAPSPLPPHRFEAEGFGWRLNMTEPGPTRFETDGGLEIVEETPPPDLPLDFNGRVYAFDRLTLEVRNVGCVRPDGAWRRAMVRIMIDGRVFEGCGGPQPSVEPPASFTPRPE